MRQDVASAPPPVAGLPRRLAAMVYDALLLFGVLCGACVF